MTSIETPTVCGALRPLALGNTTVRCSRPPDHDGWHEHGASRWYAELPRATAPRPDNAIDPGDLLDMGFPPEVDPHPETAWTCIACGLRHVGTHEGFYLGSFMACVSCERTVQERLLSKDARAVFHGGIRRVDVPLAIIVELQMVDALASRGYIDPEKARAEIEAERRARGLVDDGRELVDSSDYNLGFQDAIRNLDEKNANMVAFYENALKVERATLEEQVTKLAKLEARMKGAELAGKAAVKEILEPAPIAMRLRCPQCHELHIDEGAFKTKPHHTHACQSCGEIWRPAIQPTVGVRFLPGFKNEGQ